MISIGDNQATFQLMNKVLGLRWSEDFRGALFIPDELQHNQLSFDDVGVAYSWSNFIGRTCVISIIVQKPQCLTRAVVREAFRFPFEQCGCNAVLAMVDSVNLKSRSLCERTGFKAIQTVPGGGLEGDLIIYQALKDECRWLRKVH